MSTESSLAWLCQFGVPFSFSCATFQYKNVCPSQMLPWINRRARAVQKFCRSVLYVLLFVCCRTVSVNEAGGRNSLLCSWLREGAGKKSHHDDDVGRQVDFLSAEKSKSSSLSAPKLSKPLCGWKILTKSKGDHPSISQTSVHAYTCKRDGFRSLTQRRLVLVAVRITSLAAGC